MQVAPHGAKTSQVVVTGGHQTRFKHIFHVAGPVWNGGDNGEKEALRLCYTNACAKAVELESASIGFCSISTGIYRFPLEPAAQIALSAVSNLESPFLNRIVFAMFGEAEFAEFSRAYAYVISAAD
jgi:O-acetyl-ADP-ribose deacetylase (regulator of RNase III)